jgi:dihydropteroate synthase
MDVVVADQLPREYSFSDLEQDPIGIRPIPFIQDSDPRTSCRLGHAGAGLRFDKIELFLAQPGSLSLHRTNVSQSRRWAKAIGAEEFYNLALSRLTSERFTFAGLPLNRPIVMGIINATPDSFYPGSRFQVDEAVDAAFKMIEEGADILDIGGESSRPGSKGIPLQQEIDRVLPIFEKLQGCGIPLSIDTRRAQVMREAVSAGASIVNDITALSDDGATEVVAENPNVCVVLMHAKGIPETMQKNPQYDHVSYEIFRHLSQRVNHCNSVGISTSRIAVDPGFGFGKTNRHNYQILRDLALLHTTGCPILVGLSRKSFLGSFSKELTSEDRLSTTIAASIAAYSVGAQIHRVHDVKEIRQALLFKHRLNRT